LRAIFEMGRRSSNF